MIDLGEEDVTGTEEHHLRQVLRKLCRWRVPLLALSIAFGLEPIVQIMKTYDESRFSPSPATPEPRRGS